MQAGSLATKRRGSLAASSSPAFVPILIAAIGDQASWRYVEFFTANIRKPNTRRAYARACAGFLAWYDERSLTLAGIRPFDVAAYVEQSGKEMSAPSVKQQLAAVRMLFDWLVVGQVMPSKPPSSVRGPKHVVKTGKTPVPEGDEWRWLIDSIPTETVRDLRDRALIATLTYGFARITAALRMKVEDLRPRGPHECSGCTRKAASSTLCRATEPLPRRCTPTSPQPASETIRRAGYSEPQRGISAPHSPISRWIRPTRGAWCAGELSRLASWH